ENVRVWEALAATVRLFAPVIVPEYLYGVLALVVAMVITPVVPDSSTIALGVIALEMKPVRVTFAGLLAVSPSVMVPVPNAPLPPLAEKVPALTVRPPEKLLEALLELNVPVPSLTSAPVPVMAPL